MKPEQFNLESIGVLETRGRRDLGVRDTMGAKLDGNEQSVVVSNFGRGGAEEIQRRQIGLINQSRPPAGHSIYLLVSVYR